MPRVIGLTGGIASGKSAAADVLRGLGVPVVDADRVAREVVAPGQPALAAIREEFGDGVIGADGRLDRAALAKVVFGDAAHRRRLEAITHPAIGARSGEQMRAHFEAGHDVVVYEASLLVETGRHRDFDALLVVTAPQADKLARLRARDGIDEAAARARLEAQLPDSDKVAVADAVIDNSGDLEALAAATRAAWAEVT